MRKDGNCQFLSEGPKCCFIKSDLETGLSLVHMAELHTQKEGEGRKRIIFTVSLKNDKASQL